MNNYKLDTDTQIFFYEQNFYALSNFSSFTLRWKGLKFDTSEAAYHWEKFDTFGEPENEIQEAIRTAASAHEAFKLGQLHKDKRRPDWDDVKVNIMREILRTKANQHEYIRYKLLQSDNRELIEDSWRDDFWGWGKNKDGMNILGKLWMEIREELK